MRWIAVAAVGLAVVPVAALAVNLTGRPTPPVLVLALQVAYLAVPVATGLAVLRYRLYDVDRVIGGAVVLTAVVVVASAGYLVAVGSVGRIAGGRGRPLWVALGAFVAVVLLLQPVRRVAGRAADRLVYGPRAARYAVLVAHSNQLADAAAGASFLAGVAETTARLMGASSCRAAVRLDDGSEVSEVWPPGTPGPGGPGKGALEVTVPSDGVDVGRLVLEQRQQVRLSASRRRVLREFCERAGPAFATIGLEESLRAGATRLARVNADLAASRQRLLAADDSGRRQVAAAIRVGVVSGLREVPDRLSAVAAATRYDPPAAVGLVDACIATTTDALEELREISRAISPPLLAQRGLPAALRARGGRVQVDDRGATHRWPEDVEAAAWFCCTELVRGARGDVRVGLGSEDAEGLVVTLAFEPDDGPGGPQLEGAADRVEALGGTLERQGREVRLTFPVREQERPGHPLPLPTPE